MSADLYIVATGARTPIGIGSEPAAAAVRAKIKGISMHPFMIDQVGDSMPAALDALLDHGISGPERFLALAESALHEACAPLSKAKEASRLRLPVFLGLPELRPGFTLQDAEAVRGGLAQCQDMPIDMSAVSIFTQGHAAGFAALAAARDHLQQGAAQACLVGGVESYFQADTMEWLDEQRQLAGAVSRSGFVPGEGAGFILLMNDHARRRMGLPAAARVLSVATGKENKLIKCADICLGEGLTATVKKAVGRLGSPSDKITDIFCDINGERYRAEEWGFVCLRLPQYFEDPTAYLSPADCWGDMGAASGPLLAMLACKAAERGYAAGHKSLLWASSEQGTRGVVLLDVGETGKDVRHA